MGNKPFLNVICKSIFLTENNMAKKNQSNRLTSQQKENMGAVGIFGNEAKSHDVFSW